MSLSKTNKLTVLVSFLFLIFLPIHVVFAESLIDDAIKKLNENPIGGGSTLSSAEEAEEAAAGVVAGAINAFIAILGIFFVILAIYAGFIWMNARGRDEEVQRAKDILRTAIIGLIVILLAYSITNFVVANIYNAATGATAG